MPRGKNIVNGVIKVEKTLILLKPDAVDRGLCGEIIGRFEKRGLRIMAMKMLQLSKEQAEVHYIEHQGKAFLPELIDFITSGPLLAMVLEGENVIKLTRTMMGATNPLDALPGTIRGEFSTSVRKNVIHGSDGPASAEREIKIYFDEKEIY